MTTIQVSRRLSEDDQRRIRSMEIDPLHDDIVARQERITEIVEASRNPEMDNRPDLEYAVNSGKFEGKSAADLRQEMNTLKDYNAYAREVLKDKQDLAEAEAEANARLPSITMEVERTPRAMRRQANPENVLEYMAAANGDAGQKAKDIEALLDAYARGDKVPAVEYKNLNTDDIKAIVSTGSTTGVSVDRPRSENFVTMLTRPDLMVSDLLPVMQCPRNTDNFQFPREASSTNTFATKGEGDAAPEHNAATANVDTRLKKIIGYSTITREQAEDVTFSKQFLNELLREDLRQTFGTQVVTGDGTGDNMTGLFSQSGIKAAAARNSGVSLYTHMLDAFKVLWKESHISPDFVVVNYDDLVELMKTEDDNHNPIWADAVNGAAPRIHGIPIFASAQIPANKALAMRVRSTFILTKGGVRIEEGYANDDILKQQSKIVMSVRANVGVRLPHHILNINTTTP